MIGTFLLIPEDQRDRFLLIGLHEKMCLKNLNILNFSEEIGFNNNQWPMNNKIIEFMILIIA